jgi:hypothetical protein
MKFRMIAVTLAFAMAAWLPLAGQQTAGQSTPQAPASQNSTKDAVKHSCCCPHENHGADSASAANHDDHAMACCQAKDGKQMSCCSKDTKNSKQARTCCKDQDARLCAAKDSKPCCNARAEKPCCGKDTIAPQ